MAAQENPLNDPAYWHETQFNTAASVQAMLDDVVAAGVVKEATQTYLGQLAQELAKAFKSRDSQEQKLPHIHVVWLRSLVMYNQALLSSGRANTLNMIHYQNTKVHFAKCAEETEKRLKEKKAQEEEAKLKTIEEEPSEEKKQKKTE